MFNQSFFIATNTDRHAAFDLNSRATACKPPCSQSNDHNTSARINKRNNGQVTGFFLNRRWACQVAGSPAKTNCPTAPSTMPVTFAARPGALVPLDSSSRRAMREPNVAASFALDAGAALLTSAGYNTFFYPLHRVSTETSRRCHADLVPHAPMQVLRSFMLTTQHGREHCLPVTLE